MSHRVVHYTALSAALLPIEGVVCVRSNLMFSKFESIRASQKAAPTVRNKISKVSLCKIYTCANSWIVKAKKKYIYKVPKFESCKPFSIPKKKLLNDSSGYKIGIIFSLNCNHKKRPMFHPRKTIKKTHIPSYTRCKKNVKIGGCHLFGAAPEIASKKVKMVFWCKCQLQRPWGLPESEHLPCAKLQMDQKRLCQQKGVFFKQDSPESFRWRDDCFLICCVLGFETLDLSTNWCTPKSWLINRYMRITFWHEVSDMTWPSTSNALSSQQLGPFHEWLPAIRWIWCWDALPSAQANRQRGKRFHFSDSSNILNFWDYFLRGY